MNGQSRSLFARARPLMIARAASVGFSFLIPLVLARIFSQAEYGTYKLLFLVSQTLWMLVPFGIAQSLYYFIPRTEERRPYLVQCLTYLTVAGALTGVGIVAFAQPLAKWLNNPDLVPYAPLLGVYTFGLIGSIALEISLTARGETNRAAVAYIVSDVAKTVAMVVPALLHFGLTGVMVGIAGFAVARFAAGWVVVLQGEKGPLFDKAALKSHLRYALPFGAAMAFSIPQQSFHQYVVSAKLDAAAFAVYAVGIFNLPIIDLLYTPTSEVLMVRIAELEREGRLPESVWAFREAVTKLAYIFVPMTVFFFAIAPEFITALFTAKYLGSVPVFRVVALAILLACVPVDGALRARNETRWIFGSYVFKFAVTVPAVLFAVNHYGMMGGVGSWLFIETAGKASLIARLPKALQVKGSELFPWTQLARAGAASMLALAGVFAGRLIVGPERHAAFVVAAAASIYGLAYLVSLEALGVRLPLPLPFPRRAAKVP